MLLPANVRERMFTALEGVPRVVQRLLQPLAPGCAAWDARPDAARLTLRELVAHLADWELVWRERLDLTLRGGDEPPVLPYYDTDERAARYGYSRSDPRASLALLAERRGELVQFLRSLPEPDWERAGRHERHGLMTVEAQAVQVLAHDGYHLEQIVSWLAQAVKD